MSHTGELNHKRLPLGAVPFVVSECQDLAVATRKLSSKGHQFGGPNDPRPLETVER